MHSIRLELGDKQREATAFPQFRSFPVGDWGELVNLQFARLLIFALDQQLLRKEPETDEPEDEETEIVEAGKHDDASFLLELYQSIKSHRFRERAEGLVPVLLPS